MSIRTLLFFLSEKKEKTLEKKGEGQKIRKKFKKLCFFALKLIDKNGTAGFLSHKAS